MLISQILEKVSPSYGETWENCRKNMQDDPYEWPRIHELMDDIEIYGLQEPGVIEKDTETGEWILTNGTHRFIAHWELGYEDFPVMEPNFSSGWWDANNKVDKATIVKLYLDNTSGQFNDGSESLDHLISMMNFRLDDEYWIECETISGMHLSQQFKTSIFFWPIPDEKIIILKNRIMERLAHHAFGDYVIDLIVSQEFTFGDFE